MGNPTVIIDGMNLFIRNYVVNTMMDSNGNRCGGTIGVLRSVKKLLKDFNPGNLLVVWDGEGGSQRRKSIYKEYKAGRTVRLNQEYDFGETAETRLENMRHQRSMTEQYLTLLGIPQVRAIAVEADDLMAYIAASIGNANGYVIVTTDQDLLQLIKERGYDEVECHMFDAEGCHQEHSMPDRLTIRSCCGNVESSEVKVFSPIKKVLYDRQKFISEYGVIPENLRLVKALTGDNSDNIEGIKGFGIKTVVKNFPFLTTRSSSPQEILDEATKIKGVLGKRLIDSKERFLENLCLVDLSVPMLSATAAREAREALFRNVGCKEFDFRLKLSKDGIILNDDNFTSSFREFVMRRRKLLDLSPLSLALD